MSNPLVVSEEFRTQSRKSDPEHHQHFEVAYRINFRSHKNNINVIIVIFSHFSLWHILSSTDNLHTQNGK